MKHKTMTVVTGLIMIFAMAGCPYESSVPLSNSCNSAIDSTLLGSWVDPSAKGSDTIRIMRFNDHEYYVEVHSKGQNGINSISRGRAFVTAIKNQKILNFCELGEPDKFVFLKYEIKGNLMKTYSVSDKSIKKPLNSSRELFSYFTISSDKQGFYELPDSAVRVK